MPIFQEHSLVTSAHCLKLSAQQKRRKCEQLIIHPPAEASLSAFLAEPLGSSVEK